MQGSIFISLTTACFLFTTLMSSGQSIDFLDFTKPAPPYRVEAAVLINGKVCDRHYFIKDRPKIGVGMQGLLTIASVSSSGDSKLPINKIRFQVAIKNKRTNTTWIYTKSDVSEVDLDDLLKKCEMGDYLILMPADQAYALPDHEMYVAVGC